MSWRKAGPLGALAIVVLGACGSEFEAGGSGGASADAGWDGSGGGGGSGAQAGGAGASPDGSAGSAGAGGSTECAADFCANFDDVPGPTATWDVSEVVGSGKLELVPDDAAPSSPNLLRASVGPGDPNMDPYHAARLSLQPSNPTWATNTPRLELAFSFRVVEADPKVQLSSIANFRYGAGEHYLVVALAPPQGGTQRIIAYPAPAEQPVIELGTIATGKWQTLRMIVPKRSASAGEPAGSGATVELDGVPKTLTLTPAVLTADLRFDLGLGIPGAAGGSFVVHYDDVAIRYSDPP